MPTQSDARAIIGAKPPTVFQVYAALEYVRMTERAGDGSFEAGNVLLQEITGQSHSTVGEAIKVLVNAGVIEMVPSAGLPTKYRVRQSFARFFGKSSSTSTRGGVKRPKKIVKASPEELSKKLAYTLTERRLVVHEALSILGMPRMAKRLVAQCLKELYGLVEHDRYTVEEALEVVRYCRRKHDEGDRFRMLLNLPYIWSSKQFASYLALSRAKPVDPAPYRPYTTIADPVEREAFRRDYERRLREKGMI